jgi:hypothetical protein
MLMVAQVKSNWNLITSELVRWLRILEDEKYAVGKYQEWLVH